MNLNESEISRRGFILGTSAVLARLVLNVPAAQAGGGPDIRLHSTKVPEPYNPTDDELKEWAQVIALHNQAIEQTFRLTINPQILSWRRIYLRHQDLKWRASYGPIPKDTSYSVSTIYDVPGDPLGLSNPICGEVDTQFRPDKTIDSNGLNFHFQQQPDNLWRYLGYSLPEFGRLTERVANSFDYIPTENFKPLTELLFNLPENFKWGNLHLMCSINGRPYNSQEGEGITAQEKIMRVYISSYGLSVRLGTKDSFPPIN